MNIRHSKLTDWGLGHVSVEEHDTILDVGCGGGRTIRKLAALATAGHVYGIDHSEASVAAARSVNKRSIDAGLVDIRHGSVSRLPFSDGTFDLVTAVETHFFWPDLPADVREVLRVLKPGGTLVVIAAIYKRENDTGRAQQLLERNVALTGMRLLTAREHSELFTQAGYMDVRIIEGPVKGWICGVGRKPGAPVDRSQ